VLKATAGLIAIGVLPAILMMMSCAPAQKPVQRSISPASASVKAAPDTARSGDPGGATGPSQSSDSGGLFQTDWSPIGLDYAPETRCSDPNWHPGHRPVTCNPQLGRACGDSLLTCPARCEQCFSDDLSFIQRALRVNTIAIYQPNHYIVRAAQRLGMKVVVGLFNDSILGLSTPASQTNCEHGGTPLYLCGSNYASALIDGACIDGIADDPFKKCVSHCSQRSNPARDCANRECSCQSESDCLGPSNRCLKGAYLPPLNNPASGDFLRDGTVIGIQLGNEFFEACQGPEVPGQHQRCCTHDKTGRCDSWVVNRQIFSTAAQTLRHALDSRGLNNIKIIVNLVEKQARRFCQNGAPPPGVDYIADHPYCDYVAEMPPLWTTLSGAECWDQARNREFVRDQKACGATRTYIGETGFNSGCPSMAADDNMLKAEGDFVHAMIRAEPVCNGQPNPTAPFPNFLFEFADSCPPGGCLAGCGDPRQCSYACCCEHNCSVTAICNAGCPACVGNGYFGLFHTPGYGTSGFPPEPKLDPTPSLMCPAAAK
jgi:hypothetical protein